MIKIKNGGGKWLAPEDWRTFAEKKTTAHRIFSSRDVWIERFGDDLLISRAGNADLDSLIRQLDAWCETISFSYRRIFLKDLIKNPTVSNAPVLLNGDATAPRCVTVYERGVAYDIDFGAGYSAGLFIDQRENRVYLKALRPKKLLNCFSYTGSFSVVAALDGATTTNIDLARSAHARAKRNFELNQLSFEGHRFLTDDVRRVLPRLAKRGEKFDVIILDPPTFSRAKDAKPFQIERDFPFLLEMAIACLAPRGNILLSTNCQKIDVSDLVRMMQTFAHQKNLKLNFHHSPLPREIPESALPVTVWVKII